MKNYFGYEDFKPLIDRFIKEVISRLPDNLLGCVLFGSVARNTATANSDIDMIFLLNENNKEVDKVFTTIGVESYDWEENIALQQQGIRTKIYPIHRTEKEFSDNPLVLLDVLDHGKILYDPQGRMKNLLNKLDKKLKELKAEKIVFDDGKWAWDLKPDWKPGEIVEIKL